MSVIDNINRFNIPTTYAYFSVETNDSLTPKELQPHSIITGNKKQMENNINTNH